MKLKKYMNSIAKCNISKFFFFINVFRLWLQAFIKNPWEYCNCRIITITPNKDKEVDFLPLYCMIVLQAAPDVSSYKTLYDDISVWWLQTAISMIRVQIHMNIIGSLKTFKQVRNSSNTKYSKYHCKKCANHPIFSVWRYFVTGQKI